jgi:hypothetical protein
MDRHNDDPQHAAYKQGLVEEETLDAALVELDMLRKELETTNE